MTTKTTSTTYVAFCTFPFSHENPFTFTIFNSPKAARSAIRRRGLDVRNFKKLENFWAPVEIAETALAIFNQNHPAEPAPATEPEAAPEAAAPEAAPAPAKAKKTRKPIRIPADIPEIDEDEEVVRKTTRKAAKKAKVLVDFDPDHQALYD